MVTDARRKGSLTLEAAMVLPIAFFVIAAMLLFVQRVYIQERVQYALDDSVEEAALVSYTVMSSDVIKAGSEKLAGFGLPESFQSFFVGAVVSDLVAERLVRRHIEEVELVKWGIEAGWSGMDFSGTVLKGNDNRTTLAVSYSLKSPFPLADRILAFLEKPIVQTSSTRIWCGHLGLFAEKARSEGEMGESVTVYKAASGAGYAYHRLECLQKPVERMTFHAGFERSICATCFKNTGLPNEGDFIWVVKNAKAEAKYHTVEHCIRIHKEVEALSLEEAALSGLKPCGMCNPPVLQSEE